MSDCDGNYEVVKNSYRNSGNDDVGSCVNVEADGSIIDEQHTAMMEEKVDSEEIDEEEYEGPRPAKIQKRMREEIGDRKYNNNDDDFYDKATSAVRSTVKTTVATINCCDGDNGQKNAENALSSSMVTETQEEFTEIYRTEGDESDENQVRLYYNIYIYYYNHISHTIFAIIITRVIYFIGEYYKCVTIL